MTVDRATLLFFDAACFIAAAGRPQGGSGFLLSVCRRGYLRGVTSQPILQEAERNIDTKLGATPLARFYRLLATTPLVITAALAAGSPYVITLDRGLIGEVQRAGLSIQAMLPGEFITTMLVTHAEYRSMRR